MQRLLPACIKALLLVALAMPIPGQAAVEIPGLAALSCERAPVLPGGLVELREIDPTIYCDIRYATTNNYTRTKHYREPRCLLQPAVAERLSRVNERLRAQGYGLKVWDAYRPLSVQWALYNHPATTPGFVADPRKGSKHNRGAAVDVTLTTRDGQELDLGTGFDDMTPLAHYSAPVSDEARKNRQILRQAMNAEGFTGIELEWWHFNAPDWKKYPLLDVPI